MEAVSLSTATTSTLSAYSMRLPHVLKGTDNLIFSSAKLLDLRETVKSVVKGSVYKSLLPFFPLIMCEGFSYDGYEKNPFPELKRIVTLIKYRNGI